jgi:peptidyl-tRNA hydrolase, PTH1 family
VRFLVGLGNPGQRYARTRHNVGFMAAEEFLARHGVGRPREERGSIVAEARWAGEVILVARPQSFMNASGSSVAALLRACGGTPEDLIVAYDDADLALGTVRVRPGGRPAGHKGMLSIAEALGTEEIVRVRMGVGRPDSRERGLAEYVLETFDPSEEEAREEMIRAAAGALEVILKDGVKTAMNRYNRRRTGDDPAA